MPCFAPAGANAAQAQTAPAAPQVDVAEVVNKSIVDWQRYSGRLEAIDRVDIRPLVSGTLTAVHFRDGTIVKKGDVLFTIDPRPYAAEVDRAAAALTAARAALPTPPANWRAASACWATTPSPAATSRKSRTPPAKPPPTCKAPRPRWTTPLNLGYTRIEAPVAGRVSRAEVTVGNVVAAGAASVPLTTLVSVSKMYASFDVDEQTFLKYINPARNGKAGSVPVELGLANEDGYSRTGVVQSVDNRLDATSGTIRVRAEFDNADGSLLPGLYARIRLGGTEPRQAVLIDEKAIGTDQTSATCWCWTTRTTPSTAGQAGRQPGRPARGRFRPRGRRAHRRQRPAAHPPGDPVTPTVVPMASAQRKPVQTASNAAASVN